MQAWKLVERCFWTAGIAALGYCSYIEARAWAAQKAGNREIARALEREPVVELNTRPAQGSIVGRLEVARLGMSMVVFEGTSQDVLDLGAGHWSRSPLPGEGGNVVMAAHRDTFFRGLRNIREHDVVVVTTAAGNRQDYEVVSTRVVNPQETEVMAPTAEPALTLITCFPFEYLGSAPQRFIVRARARTRARAIGSEAGAIAVPVRAPVPAHPVKAEAAITASSASGRKPTLAAPALVEAVIGEPEIVEPAIVPSAIVEPAIVDEEIPASPERVPEPAPRQSKRSWLNPVRIFKKLATGH